VFGRFRALEDAHSIPIAVEGLRWDRCVVFGQSVSNFEPMRVAYRAPVLNSVQVLQRRDLVLEFRSRFYRVDFTMVLLTAGQDQVCRFR